MNTLEAHVLRIIGEDPSAPDVFTDDDVGMAPVRDSLNEAIQEVTMLAGGYIETLHMPLRKDVNHYRLRLARGYLGWITDAWRWDTRYPLDIVTVADVQTLDPLWMESAGNPRVLFQVGLDVIGVWPRPSSSADLIELRAVVIPAPYTRDEERIKIRAEFEHALVNYAVAEYWAGRGDARAAETHWQLYVRALGNRLGTMETPDRVYAIGRNQSPAPLSARPER